MSARVCRPEKQTGRDTMPALLNDCRAIIDSDFRSMTWSYCSPVAGGAERDIETIDDRYAYRQVRILKAMLGRIDAALIGLGSEAAARG